MKRNAARYVDNLNSLEYHFITCRYFPLSKVDDREEEVTVFDKS